MKAEAEKLKVRTGLSMIDSDWKRARKAAKAAGVPVSQFIRDAVDSAAVAVLSDPRNTAKKKGGAIE